MGPQVSRPGGQCYERPKVGAFANINFQSEATRQYCGGKCALEP